MVVILGRIFRVGIVRVGVILGRNFPRWEFSWLELHYGNSPGGNFSCGSFPSTVQKGVSFMIEAALIFITPLSISVALI